MASKEGNLDGVCPNRDMWAGEAYSVALQMTAPHQWIHRTQMFSPCGYPDVTVMLQSQILRTF